ncbi:hypothetical protein NM688_g7187 [Phlebia brevispora]|uniref:Uncharacterized protein n=1 Tax=Phlebia brevispora TaxID=194682 RepID=A0ACC1S8E8_9APHY|nr:hypothetical protein NM688_g7187 [Phlebia brevispora]
MQLYESSSDDAVRVKCVGTLECLAQHPESIDANRVIANWLLSLLPSPARPTAAPTEPLLQALSALIDIYSDETLPYDINFRQGGYLAMLVDSVEGVRRAVRGIDKKKERELRRRGEEVRDNLVAFIEYRRGLRTPPPAVGRCRPAHVHESFGVPEWLRSPCGRVPEQCDSLVRNLPDHRGPYGSETISTVFGVFNLSGLVLANANANRTTEAKISWTCLANANFCLQKHVEAEGSSGVGNSFVGEISLTVKGLISESKLGSVKERSFVLPETSNRDILRIYIRRAVNMARIRWTDGTKNSFLAMPFREAALRDITSSRRKFLAAMDISSRHLPDLSDTSVMPDASDASFQIPVGSSSRTLLADESLGFLDAVDVTLTSPQKTPRRTTRSSKAPMTFFELTPRSRPRVARSRSPRKRPAIPSPLKQAVTNDMNAALGDTLSPFKPPELSFQIPAIGKSSMDLLMDDTSGEFFGRGTTASFMEEPLSPRAREPLTLSQLTPGPRIVRSPSPAKAAIGSSEDAIDENADPAQGEDDRFLDGSPAGHTRLPSLFSNLKAEIETLVRDEHTSGEDASCSSPLAFNAQPVVPSIEGDTKNASDTVEVRSLAPSIQSAEVMPSVTNGLVTGAVSGHDSVEQTKSGVSAQEIVRYTKPTSSEPSGSTVNGMLSGKKPDSQSQLTGRTSTQTVRNYASNSETNPTQPENIDANNVSCDATVSEADGFASALASHGQTAAVILTLATTRPLRPTNTKVKSDRDTPKVGALSAVLNLDTVKPVISPRKTQLEATSAQLRAADANEQATFVEHNDQPLVPYHASPHEDEDVEMTDAPGLASNSDNQLKSPGESQAGHDASGKTPGSSAEIASHLEAFPLFEPVDEDTLRREGNGPVLDAVYTSTEEGKKVERNKGDKWLACFRRIEVPRV